MNRQNLIEAFAYILLAVVGTAVSFWGVTQIEHKEKVTLIESGCKP